MGHFQTHALQQMSGQCRDCGSGIQLIEQRLRFLQIECIEALGEPAVDRSEEIAGLIPLALIAPEPREAHCGACTSKSLEARQKASCRISGCLQVSGSIVPCYRNRYAF